MILSAALISALVAGIAVLIAAITCFPKRVDKVGIAMTFKVPQSLGSWVRHHRNVGVNAFYIYVDETEGHNREARAACEREGLAFVPYDFRWLDAHSGVPRDPAWDQPALRIHIQNVLVNDALRRSRRDGVDWLFHIDSDELLGPANGDIVGVLESIPPHVHAIYYDNLELLPETPRMTDCFAEGTTFRADGHRFLHYANGKGAARPAKRGVNMTGAHRFNPGPGGTDMHVERDKLVLYHYVACNLEQFKDKIVSMGIYTSYFGEVPYHKRNMEAYGKCARFGRDSAECDDAVENRFEERMRREDGERLVTFRAFHGGRSRVRRRAWTPCSAVSGKTQGRGRSP